MDKLKKEDPKDGIKNVTERIVYFEEKLSVEM
jgi:hypothetical protein